jgi:hypothetical protein
MHGIDIKSVSIEAQAALREAHLDAGRTLEDLKA